MHIHIQLCYSGAMLTKRLQLLLDEERHRKLTKLAKEQGVSVGAIIREAIDNVPSVEDLERRREAIRAILAAPPMPVPADPADLRRELDEAHLARLPDV